MELASMRYHPSGVEKILGYWKNGIISQKISARNTIGVKKGGRLMIMTISL